MNKFILAVISVLALGSVACASEKQDSCDYRGNAYETTTYQEYSGNCGAIPVQKVITPNEMQITHNEGCAGQFLHSSNGCRSDFNFTCINSNFTESISGRVDWSRDGSAGDGDLALVVKTSEGKIVCASKYYVRVTREWF